VGDGLLVTDPAVVNPSTIFTYNCLTANVAGNFTNSKLARVRPILPPRHTANPPDGNRPMPGY